MDIERTQLINDLDDQIRILDQVLTSLDVQCDEPSCEGCPYAISHNCEIQATRTAVLEYHNKLSKECYTLQKIEDKEFEQFLEKYLEEIDEN